MDEIARWVLVMSAPLVVIWPVVMLLGRIVPNEIQPRRTHKPKPKMPKAWVHRG
jgi:hypothetical protein